MNIHFDHWIEHKNRRYHVRVLRIFQQELGQVQRDDRIVWQDMEPARATEDGFGTELCRRVCQGEFDEARAVDC